MAYKAAGFAWVPILHVAIEQWIPPEQRIIHDPLAYRFLPFSLKGLVNLCRSDLLRRLICNLVDRKGPGIRGGLLCRKRYIDDRLKEALQTGILHSVVNLGAGLDTRLYRISGLDSLPVYEVDLPYNIQLKKQALLRWMGQVPAHIKLVTLDFATQDLGEALSQAGYSREQPAFFIWEGVTQYISEAAVQDVFAFLRGIPVLSRLVFTYICKDFIEGKHLYGLEFLYHAMRVKTQQWQFGLQPADVGAFLGQYGWKGLEQVGSVEYEQRYLKPLKRAFPLMEIEKMVYAERMSNIENKEMFSARGEHDTARFDWQDHRWALPDRGITRTGGYVSRLSRHRP